MFSGAIDEANSGSFRPMVQIKRTLLITNRTAGAGHSSSSTQKLTELFRRYLNGLSQVKIQLVDNHSAARDCTTRFLSETDAPALVVAGGGGGTLRAVVEGICDSRASKELPGPERVRVGMLRLGSGNLLAKQFGVPLDAEDALRGLVVNLKAGRTASCSVMRFETLDPSGNVQIHHGVTLGGLGQFGRIPSDLARWHAIFPVVRKTAAQWFRIEKLTNIEYAVALFVRSINCTLFPECAETIEIEVQDRIQRLRLLSGVAMNFPIAALPFRPDISVEEKAALVYLIPLQGRCSPLLQLIAPQRLMPDTRCLRIDENHPLEIRFVDRDEVELFLDEDPILSCKRLRLQIAGSIAFVPGPDYQPAKRGAFK